MSKFFQNIEKTYFFFQFCLFSVFILLITGWFLQPSLEEKALAKGRNFTAVEQSITQQLTNKNLKDVQSIYTDYTLFLFNTQDKTFEFSSPDVANDLNGIWNEYKDNITFEMQTLQSGWLYYPRENFFNLRPQKVIRYLRLKDSQNILGIQIDANHFNPFWVKSYNFDLRHACAGLVFVLILLSLWPAKNKKIKLAKKSKTKEEPKKEKNLKQPEPQSQSKSKPKESKPKEPTPEVSKPPEQEVVNTKEKDPTIEEYFSHIMGGKESSDDEPKEEDVLPGTVQGSDLVSNEDIIELIIDEKEKLKKDKKKPQLNEDSYIGKAYLDPEDDLTEIMEQLFIDEEETKDQNSK